MGRRVAFDPKEQSNSDMPTHQELARGALLLDHTKLSRW